MTTYIVSRDILAENVRKLRKRAGSVPIWAVIKGDGYGLGALPLAEALRENGIDRFCVTEVREAELLRQNGFENETILMLRETVQREELGRLLDAHVILTVGSTATAKCVNDIAATRADMAEVHLKIDTGMGRFGFLPEQTDEIIDLYRTMRCLTFGGIYTHFNCAFSDEAVTRREFAEFRGVIDRLHAAGLETGIVHCCNSAAFLRFPEMHCDAVRLGSALLGRMPFKTELQPIGYVQTQIEILRTLPTGHTTGYGALWHAKRDTPVAILPVGWYHGFHVSCKPDMSRAADCLRSGLSAVKQLLHRRRVTVEINGKRCPVVGAIGMLHVAVDVSGVPCKLGDPAVMQINPLHVKGIPVRFR